MKFKNPILNYKFAKGNNSKNAKGNNSKHFFFQIPPGNLLMILYQLTKLWLF